MALKNMKHMTIVHMGDSITVGQYVDPRLRWTTLIAERLAKETSLKGISIQSVNSGVSGETTRMGLERFPSAVQQHRPQVVTLQYGLNDCNCWETDCGLPRVSEEAFRANLLEMIARARRFGAQEIILSTNHPTLRHYAMPSGEEFEKANARYSGITREVAEEVGVTLCDVRTAFGRFSATELERLLLPVPDILHLSVEGNLVYADTIWPFVLNAVLNIFNERRYVSERL